MTRSLPLSDIRVLDFSTLLPGPVCSLLMAEAGAEVIKVEKPIGGDDMRSYSPKSDVDSGNFVILNRGKKSLALDLKQQESINVIYDLIKTCDVVIEQFRPGVMDRLQLGFESLKKINPRLIYCSITGYGQTGPMAHVAAHDLNYLAQAGLLSLVGDKTNSPNLPPALIADIAGGAYPAFMNILLALRQRDLTNEAIHLDVAMSENLFTFMYWGISNRDLLKKSPGYSDDLVTGGSPRYQIYPTKDQRFIAAAPIEDKFWMLFCELIALPMEFRSVNASTELVTQKVAEIFQSQNSSYWIKLFEGKDVCCNLVLNLEEAMSDHHFLSRSIFNQHVQDNQQQMTALPLPISKTLRNSSPVVAYPRLGSNNSEFLK
jgi:crotonobetainyl-CoA:carnitine CoA-transferase CaiB-like acyl-CoA transferase